LDFLLLVVPTVISELNETQLSKNGIAQTTGLWKAKKFVLDPPFLDFEHCYHRNFYRLGE
jgi:hypothetical protein